jgi:hypothetical protein
MTTGVFTWMLTAGDSTSTQSRRNPDAISRSEWKVQAAAQSPSRQFLSFFDRRSAA